VLVAALGTEDRAEVAGVATALETLARRLTPESLTRIRSALSLETEAEEETT